MLTVLSIEEVEKRITDDIDWWLKEYEKEDFDKILIYPKLKVKENDIVSIDLHIGDSYNIPVEKKHLPIKEEFILDSGETVNIITKEYIGLPRNIMGLVLPKLSLSIQGLSHVVTKVDPGFNGKLVESFTNLDRTKISMKKGNPLCSIIFLEVKSPYKLYKGSFLGQKTLDKVIKKLAGLNPSNNPVVNKKEVFAITTKTVSPLVVAALITLYGLSKGITLNSLGLIMASIFTLGLITYHLLR